MSPRPGMAAATMAVLLSIAVPVAAEESATALSALGDESSARLLDRRLHYNGTVWTAVANDGTIGSRMGRVLVNAADLIAAGIGHVPSFEYPAGTFQDHLYLASLWIGGIVDGDTLVSVGLEGWGGPGKEFSGFDVITQSYDPIRGHLQHTCRYYDTLVPPGSGDLIAPRPHRPLGLRIDQVSHSWQSPRYDGFIIVEYTITNISADTIWGLYPGLYADPDIYSRLRGWSAVDDIIGCLPEHNIIYATDNSGDPEEGVWLPRSARGAIGWTTLFVDPPPPQSTFNWWSSSSFFPEFDWGPRHLGDDRDFSHAGSGTPPGDANKYHVMTNGEWDYDQVWSAVNHSGDGWQPPPEPFTRADRIARGVDIRFVLAHGGYDCAPGDSVRFAVALVGADGVHVDPVNYSTHFSAENPEAFLSRLDFSELIENTARARTVYASGFDLPGAPPTQVWLTILGDQYIRCEWTPAPFAALIQYQVYRRDITSLSWQLRGEGLPSQRVWDDVDLIAGRTYEYAVASVDSSGAPGDLSPVAAATPGPPPIVPALALQTTSSAITVTWTIPALNPEYSPATYLNLYRRVGLSPETELVARFPLPSVRQPTPSAAQARVPTDDPVTLVPQYVDIDVSPGTEYHYSASLTNELGFEGARSGEVDAAPMIFDRAGLLIYHTAAETVDIIIGEISQAFYFDWAALQGCDTISMNLLPSPAGRYARFSAEELSHYRYVVIAAEDYSHRGIAEPLIDWLRVYVKHGGRAVLVARNSVLSIGEYCRFLYDVAGIRNATPELAVPCPGGSCVLSLQFAGARPTNARYPDLTVDSARAFDTDFVHNWMSLGTRVAGGGFLPGVGTLDGLADDVEVIYTYHAGVPDTSSLEGLPVALVRRSEHGQLVFFNFPLSVMDPATGHAALDAALADLGFTAAPLPASLETAAPVPDLLHWLYGAGTDQPKPSWDINHDGRIDILDAVEVMRRDVRRQP